jgi:hypothetical protein
MQTDTLVVAAINDSLKHEYRVLDGRPMYRIVWSDDELEKRIGTYCDYYGSILIREEHKCLREIKKYWYFTKPCWVLEKLVFLPHEREMYDLIKELVQARNGTYETVYKFINSKDEHLPVVHEIVEAILHTLHNPGHKLTQSDFDAIEKLEEKAEMNMFEEELMENERSPLFVWENSAFVSTNQLAFKRKLGIGQDYIEPTAAVSLD